MTPCISIIMPLYNAERFLEETLISISKQTFQDYELICINDGSDDNTVNIVQKFKNNDPRIKLLSGEKRSGAAVARNRGIKEAKGKYLIFLDGDDIFDEELLGLTYRKAEEKDADIVMFEQIHVTTEEIGEKRKAEHSAEYTSRFCHKVLSIHDIKICDFLLWPANLCGLFQKKFISENRLEFQNLPCENDTYFIVMTYFLAERIIQLETEKVMVYKRDHDTPSRISSDRDPRCIFWAMEKVKDELQNRNIFAQTYRLFNYKTFALLIDGMRDAKNNEARERYYYFLVNEGFGKLLGRYGEEYGIDEYIWSKIKAFTNPQGKRWENLNNIYEVFLENNLEEVREIINECKEEKKKIGIWGIGRNGRLFLGFCNKHGFPVDILIDSDQSKCGNFCDGYRIGLPSGAKEVDIIISTPYKAYVAVKEVAEKYNKKVRIIDLNAYVCLY